MTAITAAMMRRSALAALLSFYLVTTVRSIERPPPATAPPLPPSCRLPGGAGVCYMGWAFRRLPELDARGCCEACAAAASCEAWEIRTDNDNNCVLKNNSHAPVRPGGQGNCSNSGRKASAPVPPSPPTGVAFASVFSGGAVLQKEARVAVWGTSGSGAGTTVQLSLRETHVASATVAANGTWSAHLPPQAVSWAVILAASDGISTASVTVKFGQVVMCSGQVSSQN